jgi:hypothetical protein
VGGPGRDEAGARVRWRGRGIQGFSRTEYRQSCLLSVHRRLSQGPAPQQASQILQSDMAALSTPHQHMQDHTQTGAMRHVCVVTRHHPSSTASQPGILHYSRASSFDESSISGEGGGGGRVCLHRRNPQSHTNPIANFQARDQLLLGDNNTALVEPPGFAESLATGVRDWSPALVAVGVCSRIQSLLEA